MKLTHFVGGAVLAIQSVSAAPAVTSVTSSTTDLVLASESSNSLVVYRSPDESRSDLEKRFSCLPLRRTVNTIGTSRFTASFIALSATLASGVCAYFHGADCTQLVSIIQAALSIIYLAATAYSGGAVPEVLPTRRDLDHSHSAAQWWENALSGSEVAYETIEALPFDSSEADLHRRDEEPRLLARVKLNGIPTQDGGKQHVTINHFEGNNTVLHLPFVDFSSPELNGTHAKRADGAGFKVSYTTRKTSLLTKDHRVEMAARGAEAWASYSHTYRMSDLIGFAATGHEANFYYRIIPEVRGFGLNYESVDICGGMAQFL